MKQYCLYFKPVSSISHIPDAQTIFGAICNMLLQTQGKEVFNRYIQSFDAQPIMVHSSMFPADMLPMAQKGLFSTKYINSNLLKEDPSEQLAYLQKMKQYKKISYMTKGIYRDYIEICKIEDLKNDLINQKALVEQNCLKKINENVLKPLQVQLGTHVKKSGYYLNKKNRDSEENELYYNVEMYADDTMKFCIYIKTFLSKKEIFDIFKYSRYFGFGPRHSVGKNSFELIDVVEERNTSSKNVKLLLSKSIFDENYDLNLSYYSVFSKLHRTSKYYLENRLLGRFNLFEEGSYMYVNEDKEWYGSLIKQKIDEKEIYYYGIGFVF